MDDKERIRDLQCAMINIRGCAFAIKVLQVDQVLGKVHHEVAIERLFNQIDSLCEV